MLSLTIALLAAAAADSGSRATHTIHHPGPRAIAYVASADTGRALLERAERLVMQERYASARTLYRSVALQRASAGASPVYALRMLVDTYYYTGDLRGAAAALERVIASAAAHGDVAAQGDALADAMFVYAQLGDAARATERRDAARRLLTSPYLPAARAGALRARLGD